MKGNSASKRQGGKGQITLHPCPRTIMKKRLKIGLALLVFLFAIGEGISFFYLHNVERAISHMDETAYPLLSTSKTMSQKVAESQMELYRYKGGMTRYIDELINDVEELDEAAHALLSSDEIASLRTELKALSALIEQYKQLVSQVITTSDPKSVRILGESAFQNGLQIQKIAAKVENLTHSHVVEDNTQMMHAARTSIVVVTTVFVLFVLLFVILGMHIYERTMNPISQLLTAIQGIAQGKLEHTVPVNSNDEVGILANAFNQMTRKLKVSHDELKDRAKELTILHEISATLKSAMDEDEVLQFTLRGATEGLGFENALLFLLDRSSGKFVLKLSEGPSVTNMPPSFQIELDKSTCFTSAIMNKQPIQIVLQGEPHKTVNSTLHESLGPTAVLVPLVGRKEQRCWEIRNCNRHQCPAFQSKELQCWIVSETRCEGCESKSLAAKLNDCLNCEVFSAVGVLAVGHSEGMLAPAAKIEMLATFANQAGLAIETAQLYGKLQQFNTDLENQVEQATQKLVETQEQLSQSEKLAAIGHLAAGIAHGINNPLAVISNYTQSLLIDIKDPELREELQRIKQAVKKATSITRDLLEFSRPNPSKKERVDIHECLEDAIELAQYQSLFKQVTLRKNFAATTPTVYGNYRQLEEVCLNIILNAGQAMAGEGQLTITTTNTLNQQSPNRDVQTVPQGKDAPMQLPQGVAREFIEINFTDTGPGIKAENLHQIFEPFFTTKDVGEGVGLGMYVSYWIVEHHGGTIEVKSEEEDGATFIITLPIISEHREEK